MRLDFVSSIRSIWTYLTASPCYTTSTNKIEEIKGEVRFCIDMGLFLVIKVTEGHVIKKEAGLPFLHNPTSLLIL